MEPDTPAAGARPWVAWSRCSAPRSCPSTPRAGQDALRLAAGREGTEVLRQRLVAVADEDSEHLLFFSRNHTPLTTNNVRRRLRAILDEAGIAGVTQHSFRRDRDRPRRRG